MNTDNESDQDGYQLNALRGFFTQGSDDDDFNVCFADADLNPFTVSSLALTPLFNRVTAISFALDDHSLANPASAHGNLILRRLAETYDSKACAVYAHADNGSMACTTSDAALLFAYRVLHPDQTKVRLFDAGCD